MHRHTLSGTYRDQWREAAAAVPESERLNVVGMMKDGKTIGEVGDALGLECSTVAEIVIQEFDEDPDLVQRKGSRQGKGQWQVFNFDTPGAEFAFDLEPYGSISLLTFTRQRPDEPTDTVLIWVKTDWLDKIRERLSVGGDGEKQ